MSYHTLLFDMDETLLDYRRSAQECLKYTCKRNHIPYNEQVVDLYHRINDQLWRALERGELSRERLRYLRFALLGEGLGIPVDSDACNRDYVQVMSRSGYPLPGALELCQNLSQRYDLYLVTNGSTETQYGRLNQSGLAPYFRQMFVSQEVGAQKPSPLFFQRVFQAIGNPNPQQVLIIGDSLTSDMAGGKQAGIDTCWLAPLSEPDSVGCTWRIQQLEQLPAILEPVVK